MLCPFCDKDKNAVKETHVVYVEVERQEQITNAIELQYHTQDNDNFPIVLRARYCYECGKVFATEEHATGEEYHKMSINPKRVLVRLKKKGVENPWLSLDGRKVTLNDFKGRRQPTLFDKGKK